MTLARRFVGLTFAPAIAPVVSFRVAAADTACNGSVSGSDYFLPDVDRIASGRSRGAQLRLGR